jgi:hypothetical protein
LAARSSSDEQDGDEDCQQEHRDAKGADVGKIQSEHFSTQEAMDARRRMRPPSLSAVKMAGRQR